MTSLLMHDTGSTGTPTGEPLTRSNGFSDRSKTLMVFFYGRLLIIPPEITHSVVQTQHTILAMHHTKVQVGNW